jgi:hypothetical protein
MYRWNAKGINRNLEDRRKSVIEITEFLGFVHFWYSKEREVSDSGSISVLK